MKKERKYKYDYVVTRVLVNEFFDGEKDTQELQKYYVSADSEKQACNFVKRKHNLKLYTDYVGETKCYETLIAKLKNKEA